MSRFVTFTKFEITAEDGSVRHISCASEEKALEICGLKREGDTEEFHARRKVVKEVRVLGTEEIDVTGVPYWREEKDRIYARMVCKYCDAHPERKINRQPATHFDKAGNIVVDEPRRMVDHIYYECECGIRRTPQEIEEGGTVG